MNERSDMDRVLSQWFEDGPYTMPDRVVDVVADRIARQRQRPVWRLRWRPFDMNLSIKIGAAIAAVVILAIVGWNLLPGRSTGVGGGGTATPSPTPSPTSTPSGSAIYPPWYTQQGDGAGIIAAGSQTTRRFLAGSTLTVPEGWVNDGDNAQIYTLFPNSSANANEYALARQTAQNILIAATVANNMFAICDATGLFQGTTAAGVIDAVVANEAFMTSEPVDVTIGGLSGRQIDIQLDPGWTGSCPLQENDPATRDYGDVRNRLIVLDAPGRGPIGISIGSTYSSDFPAFLADAMPIVESLRFDFGLGAAPSPS